MFDLRFSEPGLCARVFVLPEAEGVPETKGRGHAQHRAIRLRLEGLIGIKVGGEGGKEEVVQDVDHAVAGFVAPFGDAGFVYEDGAAVDCDGQAAAFKRLNYFK